MATRPIVIEKRHVSATELLELGNFGNLVKPYTAAKTGTWKDVQIKQLNASPVLFTHYELLDTIWLCSNIFNSKPVQWQGFMANVVKGEFQVSSVSFNPMILNP